MTKFRLYDVLAINSRGEHPSGNSGADLVGVKSIPNVSAATVQEALNVIAGRAALWERARFHRRQLDNHRDNFREIIRRHKAALAECEKALGITNIEGNDAA